MSYPKYPPHRHESIQDTEWRLKQEAKELLKKIKENETGRKNMPAV